MKRGPIVVALAAAAVLLATVPIRSQIQRVRGDDVLPLFEVTRGSFTRTVQAEGFLEAHTTTPIIAPTEARTPYTVAWLAPDGSRVKAGDVLIRFDATAMERDLLDGQAERRTAQSRIEKEGVESAAEAQKLERLAGVAGLELDYARQFQSKDAEIFSRTEIIESQIDEDLARQRKDHAQGSQRVNQQLSQVELELLELERRKAELKIEQAQAGLRSLEVRAPHDGIFVLEHGWRGETRVGQTVWAGQPLAEIPQLDVMQAKIFVLEADAGGLAEGVQAQLVLESHPTETYNARVKSVAALAQRRNRRSPVQYFEVILELERTEATRMKPGQRVRAALFLAALDDVITVPHEAIVEQDDGDKVVFRRRGRTFEPVEVRLGPAALGRVVVESGLEPGDVIALVDPTHPLEQQAPEHEQSGPAKPGDKR